MNFGTHFDGAYALFVSVPMDGFDGRSMRNLLNMVYSKSMLLGKSVGDPGFYWVSDKLIRDLESVETMDDVMYIISESYEGDLKGIAFGHGKAGIQFPYTEDFERILAYERLTELMVKMAKTQKRVIPKKSKSVNEKYAFRVWLSHLGMKGAEYKITRRILLEKLNGHSAYRTQEQAEAAKEKRAQKALNTASE